MTTQTSTEQVSDNMTTEETPVILSVSERLRENISNLECEIKRLKEEVSSLKAMNKDVVRMEKTMAKSKKSKSSPSDKPKKAPSGFARPSAISPELAEFLGEPEDKLVARTEVTKRITEYVKKYGLQDEANKRIILTTGEHGQVLEDLLGPFIDPNTNEIVPLTFFVLQRYLKKHFPKAVVPPVETVETPPTPVTTEPTKTKGRRARGRRTTTASA